MCRTDVTEAIFSAGAPAILYRSDAAPDLFVAVLAVLSGQRYMSLAFKKGLTTVAEGRVHHSPHPPLSDELVLRMIARDYPVHRIAQVPGLSFGTVPLFIASLNRQLESRTNGDLERYAITRHLASDLP